MKTRQRPLEAAPHRRAAAGAVASRKSANGEETAADRIQASPRMALQRQRLARFGEAARFSQLTRPTAQLNGNQDEMDQSFAALRKDFDALHEDFKKKKTELDALLNKVGQVHLNHRFYQNRWENYRVQWSQFFSFDPQVVLNDQAHVKSKTALRKFQQKLNWYQGSGDGQALLDSTYDQFKPILEEQAQAVDHKAAIDARMRIYETMVGGVGGSRDTTDIPEHRIGHINAIANDPKRKQDIRLTQVEDGGPTIASGPERQAAGQYALAKGITTWDAYLQGDEAAPKGVSTPKFRNLFGEDTVLMGDNYRPPWHKYFASDAFFSQWLAVIKASGKGDELPTKFPSTFYRNNIDNDATNAVIKKILPGEDDASVLMKPSHVNWAELLATPNGKSTLNIVEEYSQINKARGQDEYQIKSIQVYRKNHVNCMKFEMGV